MKEPPPPHSLFFFPSIILKYFFKTDRKKLPSLWFLSNTPSVKLLPSGHLLPSLTPHPLPFSLFSESYMAPIWPKSLFSSSGESPSSSYKVLSLCKRLFRHSLKNYRDTYKQGFMMVAKFWMFNFYLKMHNSLTLFPFQMLFKSSYRI